MILLSHEKIELVRQSAIQSDVRLVEYLPSTSWCESVCCVVSWRAKEYFWVDGRGWWMCGVVCVLCAL